MTAQLILSSGFVLLAVYAWSRMSSLRLVGLAIMALSVVATYFVWHPERTTDVAHLVGVGRGADLIIYFLFLFVLFGMLVLDLKMHRLMQMLTVLARQITIQDAERTHDLER